MMTLRHLLVGLLTVAVAQFGVVAAAPAHAHEGGGHGVREIAISHQHAEAHLEHHHGAEHSSPIDKIVDGSKSDGPGAPSNKTHGDHAHVHSCPQFTTADQAVLRAPARYREGVRPVELSSAISGSTYPPHRPPRATL